tara:strand:+ start:440 stop:613 length:174 start_codon:yes stop_codon:yes gene_type:complete
MEKLKDKTYKREVAAVLLLGLGYLVFMDKLEMVNAVVWPIIGFAAGAFGIAAVKQLR